MHAIYTKNDICNIIKIQSIIRGFLVRNKNKQLKDCIGKKILLHMLKIHIINHNLLDKVNKEIKDMSNKNGIKKCKICRHNNFPSHISENIAKFAIYKKYKIMPNWNTVNGDLTLCNRRIEIKAFSSKGPTSFGPTENWDYIYFVDCLDFTSYKFKIYELKFSNTSDIWSGIKLNKNDTYKDIVDKNQRGKLRSCFSSIYEQIKNHTNLIFDGHINDLF